MKKLKSLRVLAIGSANITDDSLKHLKAFSNLEELHFINANVTDAGVRDLQKSLPKLKVLSIVRPVEKRQ